MNTLYIIRGVSGSGKTTLARKMSQNSRCPYHEADQYFEGIDGEYDFDPTKLPLAHKWCMDQVIKDLRSGSDTIVSNTFTRLSEIEPYVEVAIMYGCNVRIITCTGTYENVHNVPAEQVAKQRKRFASNWDLTKHFIDETTLGRLTVEVYP